MPPPADVVSVGGGFFALRSGAQAQDGVALVVADDCHVARRRLKRGVAHQPLHHPDVDTRAKEARGVCVAASMDRAVDAQRLEELADSEADALGVDVALVAAWEPVAHRGIARRDLCDRWVYGQHGFGPTFAE